MSSPVGAINTTIDTQDVEVDNVTDGNIYRQVLSVMPGEINHEVDVNELSNDAVEKLYSLTDAKYDIRALVTEPEFVGLATLAKPVGAQLPIKTWTIRMTDQMGNATTITGEANVSKLTVMDRGIGSVELIWRLDFQSGSTISVLDFT